MFLLINQLNIPAAQSTMEMNCLWPKESISAKWSTFWSSMLTYSGLIEKLKEKRKIELLKLYLLHPLWFNLMFLDCRVHSHPSSSAKYLCYALQFTRGLWPGTCYVLKLGVVANKSCLQLKAQRESI